MPLDGIERAKDEVQVAQSVKEFGRQLCNVHSIEDSTSTLSHSTVSFSNSLTWL